jgi:hypothetical protein
MSGRLDLRRGVVVATDPLTVEIDGERRRAWADEVLLGETRRRSASASARGASTSST